jgi:hypothetical protein
MLTPLLLTILAMSPALPVNLRLDAIASSSTEVVFRVSNAGESPLRVAMNRGLLSLEVRVPGRRAPLRCAPPPGVRPSSVDPERVATLAPGASMAEVVDLRWFCWSARAAEALWAPGATVSARYGFRRASARTWIASSLDGVTRVGAIQSEPLAVPTPQAPAAPATTLAALSLRAVPDRRDTGSGRSAAAVLRLENTSPDDVRVFVRPELFHFDVQGPVGALRCSLGDRLRAPLRESFARLAPRGRTSLALDLAAVCPSGTFATPGVYDVAPVFEATEDGARVGLRAVTGTIVGAPLAVRVGAGDLPGYQPQEPAR